MRRHICLHDGTDTGTQYVVLWPLHCMKCTPLVEGGEISTKQRVLSAASVQSLMAFQMSSGHYRLIMTLNGILHM